MDVAPDAGRSRPRLVRTIAAAVLGVAVVVYAGFVLRGLLARAPPLSLHPAALIVAAVAYGAGVAVSGVWWHALLDACGAPVGLARAVVAYAAGTSGKYVPGKAASIALRALLVGAPAPAAAAAATLEALATAATGGLLAAVFAPLPSSRAALAMAAALALALAVGLFVVAPRVSTWFAAFDRKLLARVAPRAALTLVSWALFAASLCACFPGFGAASPPFFVALAAIAGGSVVGFLVPVPAGLGARELAVVTLLGAGAGGVEPASAAAAAVVVRGVWIACDLAATCAGVIVLRFTRRDAPGAPR